MKIGWFRKYILETGKAIHEIGLLGFILIGCEAFLQEKIFHALEERRKWQDNFNGGIQLKKPTKQMAQSAIFMI